MSVLLVCLLATSPAEAASTEWYDSMRVAWSSLTTYKATQRVQERVRGELTADQRMSVVFRKPWEIQLEWETVHPGRRAYWNPARFGGSVRVDPGGWTGSATGILTFKPDNPLLRQDTNRSMAQAGFGYLVERLTKALARDAAAGTLPEARPDVVEGEPAWIVSLGPDFAEGYAGAELALGQNTDLPLRWTAYDASGKLLERYHWLRVAVNARVVDKVDFDLALAGD
jgi:hypothetical protein